MSRKSNYKPKLYFTLVLSATAIFWGLGGYMSFRPGWAALYMLPMLIGLMMPAVFAVGFLWHQPDRQMRRDFICRTFSFRLIRPLPFVGSLVLMPLSVLIAISLSLLLGGSSAQFDLSEAFSFSTGVVPVFALLFLAAVFEELGWRGYGYESLEKGMGFLGASLLFGSIWSLWHLPLLWVKNSYQYEIYQLNPLFALNFYLGTALMGIIVTWVCHINKRSILATILFHFAINLSQEMLSMTQTTKCLQTLVLGIFACAIIFSVYKPRLMERSTIRKTVCHNYQ